MLHKDIDAAPYGGARFQIEALIDGKRFTIFDLDIGIGDVWIGPQLKTTHRLNSIF
jgi:hypothetical protein